MTETELRPATPDDADWIVKMHGALYARDEGFDESFPALVAEIVAAFFAEHDETCESGWVAWREGQRLGCIFCVRQDDRTAKLRLFLLLPEARGLGLGRRLLAECMGFAQAKGYAGMQLWTHESHRAACALYARTGWRLLSSVKAHSFGMDVTEQHWAYEF